MNEQAPQICIPPIKLRKTKNIGLVDLTKITWENEVRIPEAIINDLNQRDQSLINSSSNIWFENYNKFGPRASLQITALVYNDCALVYYEGRRALGECLATIPRKTEYGT